MRGLAVALVVVLSAASATCTKHTGCRSQSRVAFDSLGVSRTMVRLRKVGGVWTMTEQRQTAVS